MNDRCVEMNSPKGSLMRAGLLNVVTRTALASPAVTFSVLVFSCFAAPSDTVSAAATLSLQTLVAGSFALGHHE
jgi:hypothetical protein